MQSGRWGGVWLESLSKRLTCGAGSILLRKELDRNRLIGRFTPQLKGFRRDPREITHKKLVGCGLVW